MTAKEENNLTLRIIEYGLKNEPFQFDAMKKALKIDESTSHFIMDHLINYTFQTSPNHIISTVKKYSNLNTISKLLSEQRDITFRVLPSAAFSYIDHLEIIEARKAARSARNLSWIAIAISILLTSLQIIFDK